MRLICFWCFLLAAAVRAQNDYYAPQTFQRQNVENTALFEPMLRPWGAALGKVDEYQRGLFSPSSGRDVVPQSTAQSWSPQSWKNPAPAPSGPATFKQEPWRLPFAISKEQQASIIHHKQALSADGAFQFEYSSDNGLAAGEQIQPDGSRVGAYQYKDPNGQLVKLKYKAGKDGFQILEGSHLPKSPEPVAPQTQDNHYQNAYMQQRQQYNLQQQYNQQRPDPQYNWRNDQVQEGQKAASGQYFVQNLSPQGGPEDDGQYRENEVDKGPHSFGEGYAFAFKG